MASYVISSATLYYKSNGYKSTGWTGFVYNHSELEDYITDYRKKVHTTSLVLLSESFGNEFKTWQDDFVNRRLKSTGGVAFGAIKTVFQALTYNPKAIITGGQTVVDRFKSVNELSSEPWDFLVLDARFNQMSEFTSDDFYGTRIGVFLR